MMSSGVTSETELQTGERRLGLLTTNSFEVVVVQVVNLRHDADMASTVAGALAEAAYGLMRMPRPDGEKHYAENGPWNSGWVWRADELAPLVDRLVRPGDSTVQQRENRTGGTP